MFLDALAATSAATPAPPEIDLLRRAYLLMHTAAEMAALYEAQKAVAARYVHATARGHEAVQLAAAFLLTGADYAAPYYRDDALLLGLGLRPYELMLQLLAKRDDPFSGGARTIATPACAGRACPSFRTKARPLVCRLFRRRVWHRPSAIWKARGWPARLASRSCYAPSAMGR
ncbi:thiamine pyrophosphate-dependent enzyme [Hymenobacter sp. BRD128]|uniref:thiamine pyrophosphate-dependent enzyme n=1 Tax=Hymenobacter sp. BRD128 TaxID=2675878 RepID=UPI0020B8540C|nr:thiamine pyrophosphate-dependent enzyme [Hymenobacter sp. BRD128]